MIVQAKVKVCKTPFQVIELRLPGHEPPGELQVWRLRLQAGEPVTVDVSLDHRRADVLLKNPAGEAWIYWSCYVTGVKKAIRYKAQNGPPSGGLFYASGVCRFT